MIVQIVSFFGIILLLFYLFLMSSSLSIRYYIGASDRAFDVSELQSPTLRMLQSAIKQQLPSVDVIVTEEVTNTKPEHPQTNADATTSIPVSTIVGSVGAVVALIAIVGIVAIILLKRSVYYFGKYMSNFLSFFLFNFINFTIFNFFLEKMLMTQITE